MSWHSDRIKAMTDIWRRAFVPTKDASIPLADSIASLSERLEILEVNVEILDYLQNICAQGIMDSRATTSAKVIAEKTKPPVKKKPKAGKKKGAKHG